MLVADRPDTDHAAVAVALPSYRTDVVPNVLVETPSTYASVSSNHELGQHETR